jgi:hypothetical protein
MSGWPPLVHAFPLAWASSPIQWPGTEFRQVSGWLALIGLVCHSAAGVGLPDGEWLSTMSNAAATIVAPASGSVRNWK